MPDDRFSKTSILLLAGAALIGAAMLLTLYWEAVQRFETSNAERDPHQCMQISKESGRLACFEKLLNQPPPQPARGANAPTKLLRE
jgi:hypothetical protein